MHELHKHCPQSHYKAICDVTCTSSAFWHTTNRLLHWLTRYSVVTKVQLLKVHSQVTPQIKANKLANHGTTNLLIAWPFRFWVKGGWSLDDVCPTIIISSTEWQRHPHISMFFSIFMKILISSSCTIVQLDISFLWLRWRETKTITFLWMFLA